MVTHEECQKVQCGCISQQQIGPDKLYECTTTFGSGVLNPAVEPCLSLCPSTGLPTSLSVPSIHNQPAPIVLPNSPVLTAKDVVQPLPDISRMLAPMAPPPSCSLWCDINAAIRDYPLVAIGILVGGFLLIRGGRR